MDVPRAQYTPFKESEALRPHPNTAEPNFATLFLDERHWTSKVGTKLYRGERFPEGEGRHPLLPRKWGAKTQYNWETGDKKSMADAVADHGFSRAPTTFSMQPRFLKSEPVVGANVGPGQYYREDLHSSMAHARSPTAKQRLPPGFFDDRKRLVATAQPRSRRGPAVGVAAAEPRGEQPRSGTAPARGGGYADEAMLGSSGAARAGYGRPQTTAGRSSPVRRRGAPQPHGGRPQTRAELRDLTLFYQRQQMAMQRRRLLKKREDRESEPLVDHQERLSSSWTHRNTLFPTSVDLKGPPLSTQQRFADLLREEKRSASIPAPGQYYRETSFVKKPVARHDPRNDFPAPRRRSRRPRRA